VSFELRQRQGMAEQIALEVAAAVSLEEFELLGSLHALGDHLDAEMSRHAEDGLDDHGVIVVDDDVTHERPIDLEHIDR